MSIFEHNHRARIYNPAQHPYHHSADEFAYTSSSMPGSITTLGAALDYVVAVLYPNAKPAVATVADLPAVGNTINDYRVVNDDGDGKAASYRWEQREGEASASWHKIADVDWGSDSVLQEWQNRTQDLFVMRWGYDGIDATGAAIVGDLAGQVIYGGKSASTNLTLYPNSGDGAGAVSGYVQTASHFRPIGTSNTLDLGASSYKFRSAYLGTSLLVGTATISGGTYADSSGAVSFGALNLSTTGTLGAGTTTVTSLICGTTTLTAGAIADTGGSFSFNALNVSTSGSLTGGSLKTGTATIIGGNYADSSGALSFNALNLATTGTLAAGATTVTSLIVGTTTITSHTLADTFGSFSFGAVNLSTSGTLAAGATTVTGTMNATTTQGGNLQLASNTLSSTNTNGDITVSPNGTGTIKFSAKLVPTVDATDDIGTTLLRIQSLYMSGSVGDGTNTIAIATLLSLRAILTGVSSGYGIFYNGSQWVAADPDTEVFHDSISHLTGVGTDGDAGHSQFVVAAGRASAQTIKGGTGVSANLTLDSTANATKGKILCSSDLAATSDAVYSSGWTGTNLGGASNRWNNVYAAGEFIGMRLENLSSDPTSSAQNIGRSWWNTTTGYIGVDTGSAVQRVSILRYSTDTSWDGIVTSKSVTVSGIDATQALWMLRDNTNNYEIMQVKITSTGSTNVTITVNAPLPAGSYRLIGLQ